MPLHHSVCGTSQACLELLLGTAPHWHYTAQQLNEVWNVYGFTVLHSAVEHSSLPMCRMLIAAGADPKVKVAGKCSCLRIALGNWPDRHELAAMFEPGGLHEPLTPPSCANCQTSGIKLSACSKCHAVRYCSTACQRAHWRSHKPACQGPEDVYDAVAANLARFAQ